MNRPENVRNAGRNYSRVWMEFIKMFGKDSNRLFCFFEGQDDVKYYGSLIESNIQNNKRENLWSRGKDGVLHLLNLVSGNEKYQRAWVAFFIDKDFDDEQDLPSDERLYITPCYSIENLYVTLTAFERILRDEFHLSDSDSDRQMTIRLYEARLEEFNDATEELNAWIYLQRLAEKSQTGTRLNLNDVNMKGLFDVKLTQVEKKYTFESLNEMFPNAAVVSKQEVAQQIVQFRGIDRTMHFRGKFLLEFLRIFIRNLTTDRVSRNRNHFSERGKVKLNLSGNLISELTQYADTPDSLKQFLSARVVVQPR